MNKEQAKKWQKEIIAFGNGKNIQCGYNDVPSSWEPDNDPDFSTDNIEYRIEPEPVERWIPLFSDGNGNIIVGERNYESKAECECDRSVSYIKAVKVLVSLY